MKTLTEIGRIVTETKGTPHLTYKEASGAFCTNNVNLAKRDPVTGNPILCNS